MAPAKQGLHVLLLLLICSFSTHAAATVNTTAPCLPDQASSLLQLKSSFIVANNLSSWQAGTDCCYWKGIICDKGSGRIISLDLSEFELMSLRLHPALFNLTSLRNLNLAFIDFTDARLPESGFERLTDITHLNFSNTYFIGQIPIGISRLKNLVTLDFSHNDGLYLQVPSFQTFMANISNLRELHLDYVNLSSSGLTWSTALADSVPQLQILSLPGCHLSGSIFPSFSRLRGLMEIYLAYNWGLRGKVPEYFSELSSLRSLDISSNNFEGQFPTEIFQLKNLSTLDLSWNPKLFVRLTYFPAGNNLQNLNLAWTNFTCDTPLSFANLTSLQTLGLTTATIAKELLTSIRLPSLHRLELVGSGLEKLVLSWVGNLKELKYLELDGYDFSQSVPSWIGNLTRLETLKLWDCDFSMPIPHQIGYLSTLTFLEFMGGDAYGQQIPSWIGNLTKLTGLDLNHCNFSGPIPSTIGNLIHLEEVQFSYNRLTGNIPKSLFALPALQVVYLDGGNQLSGSLEDIPTPLSSPLTIIELSGNQLTGSIPKSFFQLVNLQYLNLESNKLKGTIELSSIWGLRSLILLSLSNNTISVIDNEGETITPLPSIKYLYLASCNLTKFPTAFRYLDAILELDLSNNQIKGAIPSWIWETWTNNLNSLDLSHNMFTTLEKSPSLIHMSNLAFLDLSSNRLQGTMPIPVTSSKQIALDYSNNSFSSIVPNDFGKYFTNGIYINLSKNKLSGHIPFSLCGSNVLETMDLSCNHFSGSLPSCLLETGIQRVLLRENKLHGVLPTNITKGCKLQTIDLNGNQIQGTLPQSLKNCQDLELLDIGNNQISGSFPSWMGTLPNLRILVLRSNQLSGTVRILHSRDQSTKHFTSLQIIDLASNHFSGELLSEWFHNLKSMMNSSRDDGQILKHHTRIEHKSVYQDTVTITYKGSLFSYTKIQTTLKVIDFSNNSFEGPIPESIGKLISLHGLNMSYNSFTGKIPSQLGDLAQLESLDLSWNHLIGEIPQDLTSLTSLALLNLSYNNLTGRIPQGNQFLTFPNSSFDGNPGLCGKQVSKQCDNRGPETPNGLTPSTPNNLWQDRLGTIFLFTFVGLGFGVGFTLTICFLRFCYIEG